MLGTSSIVDETTHEPLLSVLSLIVETAVKLRKDGHKVVIVSSGAIGVGLRRMEMDKRPKQLPKVQALAAIGQCRLMSLWDQLFSHMRQPVAQILLTRNDIADRTQYLNAQNTLFQLMEMDVIPIVNENDTISVTEIKFGDNDTLSAIAAGMVHADYLFLMTDVDCLYDKNPRTNPDAKPIQVIEDISQLQADVSGRGSSLGTGGMSTKLVAASLATSAGVTTIITKSSRPGNIRSIVNYVESLKSLQNSGVSTPKGSATPTSPKPPTSPSPLRNSISDLRLVDIAQTPNSGSISNSPALEPTLTPPSHTRFLPNQQPIRDRYFWLLHGLAPHGSLYIDQGAHAALTDKAGLLPVGVVDVQGSFAQQECVRIYVVRRRRPSATRQRSSSTAYSLPTSTDLSLDLSTSETEKSWTWTEEFGELEVGRAIVNYASTEIRRIMGLKRSEQIGDVLGYADSEYVCLRENIAFFAREGRSRPQTPSVESASVLLGGGFPLPQ
jgi:glutamate 5-kinase